jgi:cytochrome P450
VTEVAHPVEEADLPPLEIDDPLYATDPQAVIARARQHGRFAASRRGVEVLAHDDVMKLLLDNRLHAQDTRVWQRYGAQERLSAFIQDGLLSAMQGERHSRIRRIFLAAFRARHIEDQRPLMRSVAEDLIADWPASGGIDFVTAFTLPYPMRVLCQIVGIPTADIPEFSAAATQLHLLSQSPLEPGFPAIEKALSTLWDYCLGLVAIRRDQPSEDAISALIAAQETEGRITDDELVWNIVNLIFAGQDTTRYQLASAIRAIDEQPGLWDRLHADPSSIPGICEETLRIYPVTNFVVRIPQEDFVYEGVRFAKGRRVILNFQAASRDPEHFGDPAGFSPRSLNRGPETYDVPFGLGSHFCLGAALAKAEIQEAVTVLVSRFSRFAVTGPSHMTTPAGMLYGPENLPVDFTRR